MYNCIDIDIDADLSVLKTYFGQKMYINVDSMFYSPPQ